MNSKDVTLYLEALSEELEKRSIRKPVRLAVVGGVYMMLVIRKRTAVNDIDMVPLDFSDPMKPDRATRVFRWAARVVAQKYEIRRDWLDLVPPEFIPPLGSLTLCLAYKNLQIYAPRPEYMLALKLLVGREKERDDLTVLCEILHVHTREHAQELVDRYANRQQQHDFGLEKTLDTLFPPF